MALSGVSDVPYILPPHSPVGDAAEMTCPEIPKAVEPIQETEHNEPAQPENSAVTLLPVEPVGALALSREMIIEAEERQKQLQQHPEAFELEWPEEENTPDGVEAPNQTDAPVISDIPGIYEIDFETGEIIPWVASKPIIDELKMELSSADPETQEYIEKKTQEVTYAAIAKYMEYVPEHSIERVHYLSNRVIVMDRADVISFYEEWHLTPQIGAAVGYAAYTGSGDLIRYGDQTDNWKRFSEDVILEYMERKGATDLEEGKKLFAKYAYDEALAHEPFHSLQNPYLLYAFKEAGAYYYQREMAKIVGLGSYDHPIKSIASGVYQELLDTYGDDVHRLFFGSLFDLEKSRQIMDTITPEFKWQILNGDKVNAGQLAPEQ